MQNGSIVVVKKLPEFSQETMKSVQWLPTDDERATYVLRDGVMEDGEQLFRLEEGIIGYNPNNQLEWALPIRFFIEIMPPEEQVDVQSLFQPEIVYI